jgi:hypothetical protein
VSDSSVARRLVVCDRRIDGWLQSAEPDADDGRGASALFRERTLELRAFHSRALTWATETRLLPNLGEPLASESNDRMQTQVVVRSGVLCHIRLSHGWTEVALAAPTLRALDDAERDLRATLPCPEPTDSSGSSLIRLWHRGE